MNNGDKMILGTCRLLWTVLLDEMGITKKISNALDEYHAALDNRQHAGVAAGKLADAVELALGKPWGNR